MATALENANESLQNGALKEFLLGTANIASGIGGALGIIGSVVDLFVGKSNKNAITKVQLQPTVSSGSLSLEGTIHTQTNAAQYTLQLPGSNHQYPDGTYNYDGLPVYDCPLGLIGLARTPVVKYHDITEFGPMYPIVVPTTRYYIFDDVVELTINQSAKVKLLSAKAQLVADPKEPFRSNIGIYLSLEYGKYQMNEYRPDGNHKYSTIFIDLAEFRNTQLAVIPGTEVYLKLLVVLEPIEEGMDKTPIVYTLSHHLDAIDTGSSSGTTFDLLFSGSPSTSFYRNFMFGTWQQNIEEDSQNTEFTTPILFAQPDMFPSGWSNITVATEIIPAPNTNINMSARTSITFKPGTVLKSHFGSTFRAGIERLNGIYANGTNALSLKEYFADCNCFPAQLKRKTVTPATVENSSEDELRNLELRIFPNPANNHLTVQLGNANFPAVMEVYNSSGLLIDKKVLIGFDYKLDVSGYPKGLYILTVYDEHRSRVTEKFIKN